MQRRVLTAGVAIALGLSGAAWGGCGSDDGDDGEAVNEAQESESAEEAPEEESSGGGAY